MLRFGFCLFISFFLFLPTITQAAGAAWPISDYPRFWLLGEGSWHFSLDGNYFYSAANFDSQGVVRYPSTLDRVIFATERAHVAYGLAPNFSIFGQISGNYIAARYPLDRFGNNMATNENYGMGDAFLAARWMFYRSRTYHAKYPTEWAPNAFIALLETSWNFPTYSNATNGRPPLGDQSNDFTGMLRAAWYANTWLTLSAGFGYTYRTAQYSSQIPYNLRADFALNNSSKMRFWTDFIAQDHAHEGAAIYNSSAPDPISNGSFLFKTTDNTQRQAGLGAAILLSRSWELASAWHGTTSGVNSAKGWDIGLGFTYRPYLVPEIDYEQEKIVDDQKVLRQKFELKKKVLHYGLVATVLKVSSKNHFLMIGFGSKDGLQVGDAFHIFKPNNNTMIDRKLIAFARVVRVTAQQAFLRVETHFEKEESILPGYEAQRVILDE